MSTLFERFLERLLRITLATLPLDVLAKQQDSIFWRPDEGKRYGRGIRPDLLVSDRGEAGVTLPIDAKYKRYDARSVDSGDLAQVFLY